VHAKQALVLVNYGGASGEDIFTLAQQVQKSVNEKFGIELQTEVNII
jgi:UDP-N-acetylmuramate dehydrogenase